MACQCAFFIMYLRRTLLQPGLRTAISGERCSGAYGSVMSAKSPQSSSPNASTSAAVRQTASGRLTACSSPRLLEAPTRPRPQPPSPECHPVHAGCGAAAAAAAAAVPASALISPALQAQPRPSCLAETPPPVVAQRPTDAATSSRSASRTRQFAQRSVFGHTATGATAATVTAGTPRRRRALKTSKHQRGPVWYRVTSNLGKKKWDTVRWEGFEGVFEFSAVFVRNMSVFPICAVITEFVFSNGQSSVLSRVAGRLRRLVTAAH